MSTDHPFYSPRQEDSECWKKNIVSNLPMVIHIINEYLERYHQQSEKKEDLMNSSFSRRKEVLPC